MVSLARLIVCTAILVFYLEPSWIWTNTLFGTLTTHTLIGNVFASEAIKSCFVRNGVKYDSTRCRRDFAALIAVDLGGGVFFGFYGHDLSEQVVRLVKRWRASRRGGREVLEASR